MHMITTAVGIALAFTLGLTQLFGPAVQGNIQPETSRANVCAARFVDMNDDGICDNRCGGGNFVDADGDGICDNRCGGGNFVDADGDGICDNRCGGGNFVDADGDGICDNRCGGGNFVDADGDGICDNRGSQSSCGNGGNRDNNHCGRRKHCK